MKVMVLGRSRPLLNSAKAVLAAGHSISLIHTSVAEDYYKCDAIEFERFASENEIPFVSDRNLRSSKEIVMGAKPDICISMNWISLVKSDFIELFPGGVVNAHAGDLPRYRGNAAPNWAILNGEDKLSLSLHLMDAELDTGPILIQETFKLDRDTYIGEVYEWLESRIPVLFEQVVSQRMRIYGTPQSSDSRPLRAFPRRPSDSEINWCMSTTQILRLIRASSYPFDGAYTHLEGRQLVRVLRAREYLPDFDFLAVPGQVCFANGEAPVIATADGLLEIEECRVEDYDNVASSRLVLKSLRHRLFTIRKS